MQNTNTNVVDFLNSHYSIKERKRLLTRTRSRIIVKFRLRANKDNCKTTNVIYVRLRVNGTTCCDFTTGIVVERSQWDSPKMRIKGHSAKIEEKNRTLRQIEDDLLILHSNLVREGVRPTAKMLKDLYTKKVLGYPSLVQLAESFLSQHQQKVRTSTMYQHRTKHNKLLGYLDKTKQKSIEIHHINTIWVNHFYNYLTNESSTPAANRVVQWLSQLFDFAVDTGTIENNPIKYYKLPKTKSFSSDYLNENELQTFFDFQFNLSETLPKKVGRPCNWNLKMSEALNLFLLACFTGISSCDLLHFNPSEDIKTDEDGTRYIILKRKKNGNTCIIPLMKEAQTILERMEYKIPKLRNDEYNSLLKKVANHVEFPNPNRLKTHLARKTAATLLLNRGVPIYIVSKVLGHKSVRTTEKHYATLLDSTIKRHFKELKLL